MTARWKQTLYEVRHDSLQSCVFLRKLVFLCVLWIFYRVTQNDFCRSYCHYRQKETLWIYESRVLPPCSLNPKFQLCSAGSFLLCPSWHSKIHKEKCSETDSQEGTAHAGQIICIACSNCRMVSRPPLCHTHCSWAKKQPPYFCPSRPTDEILYLWDILPRCLLLFPLRLPMWPINLYGYHNRQNQSKPNLHRQGGIWP